MGEFDFIVGGGGKDSVAVLEAAAPRSRSGAASGSTSAPPCSEDAGSVAGAKLAIAEDAFRPMIANSGKRVTA